MKSPALLVSLFPPFVLLVLLQTLGLILAAYAFATAVSFG